MSAQILTFPKQPTTADLCREMAYTVRCADPEDLRQRLEAADFGSWPNARHLLAAAKRAAAWRPEA